MKIEILLTVLLLVNIKVNAQAVLSNNGAANESLGGRIATATGTWSLWGNPAGVAFSDNLSLGFGLGQQRGIPLTSQAIILSIPTKTGAIATGVNRFGDDLYREQVLSLAFANKLDITTLGIRAEMFQLLVDDHPSHTALGITIGGIISAGKHVKIGATARNVNLPRWKHDEKLPVVLSAGVSFQPTEQFTSMIEVEKNTDHPPVYKAGFEYGFKKKMWIRTGVNLFPNAAFGGFGLSAWRLLIEYAMRYAIMPGYHHQVSLTSHIGKRQRKP